jgi:PAS domain S-box-containing protein
MNDYRKTKAQLVAELAELRQRVATMEATEKSLRESEERTALILRLAPLGICECDMDGRITYVNPCEEAIVGYPASELIGSYVWERMASGPARDALPGLIKQVIAEQAQPFPYESQHLRNNGKPYDVRVDWSFKHDAQGRIAGFVCIITDITEQKRCQEALQRAHDDLEENVKQRTSELLKANEQLTIFQRFAEASEQGFGIADLSGHLKYVNPAMCRMMGGAQPNDMVGRHLAAFVGVQSDVPVMDEYLAVLFREGRWAKEGSLLTLQGTLTPIHNSSFLIRDDEGKPAYVAGVVTDITERKRVELALRKEKRTLKHLLQSSDHERQLIAYEIHDGLAQELAGAIMHFDAYHHLNGTGSKEAAKAFDAAMALLRQGHSEARRLISGVRPPILDESGVVDAIAHLVHEEGRKTGPKIDFFNSVAFDRLAPTMENAVYRITQEAILNACKHSKSEKVRVELVQEGDDLRVSIRDWGTGFDIGGVQENRFGLDGIRERARLLGGTCSIQSAPGNGTQVTVELPLMSGE